MAKRIEKTVNIKILGDDSPFRKTMGGVGNLAAKTAKAAAAAFAAVGVAATKAVSDFRQFQKQFTQVKGLLDETSFSTKTLAEGTNDLKKGLLNLRAETGETFTNLNKGLFDLISAGVDAEDAIDTLRVATELARAGATTTAIAVDGLTNAMNAFELEASDAAAISEKFFTAQKFGKTTIEELSSGIGRVASTANQMGVSLDEVLAATSAATIGAIETNQAYTGLAAVFANIIRPTKDASDEAARLGIEFNSTALRAKSLKGFLDSITQSANFNSTSLEKLFGSVEATKTIMALGGAQADDFANILNELGNEAQRSATFSNALGLANDTLDQKLNKAFGAAGKLAVQLGEKLAPHVIKVAEKFSEFAEKDGQKFIDGVVKTLEVVKDLTDIGISGLVTGVNTLRAGLGGLLKPLDLAVRGFSALTGLGKQFSSDLRSFSNQQMEAGFEGARSGLTGMGRGFGNLFGAGEGLDLGGGLSGGQSFPVNQSFPGDALSSGGGRQNRGGGAANNAGGNGGGGSGSDRDSVALLSQHLPTALRTEEQQEAYLEALREQKEQELTVQQKHYKRLIEEDQKLREKLRESLVNGNSEYLKTLRDKNITEAQMQEAHYGILGNLFQQYGLDSLANNKLLATKNSILNIQEGISEALSLPFPSNLAAAAIVAAEGAAVIGTIKGVQADLKGAAAGGIVGGFDTGRDNQMMAVRSGEMIVPPDLVKPLMPTLRDVVRQEDTGGSMPEQAGSQTISVEFKGDAARLLREIEREGNYAQGLS